MDWHVSIVSAVPRHHMKAKGAALHGLDSERIGLVVPDPIADEVRSDEHF
jgi:hypothetical protein